MWSVLYILTSVFLRMHGERELPLAVFERNRPEENEIYRPKEHAQVYRITRIECKGNLCRPYGIAVVGKYDHKSAAREKLEFLLKCEPLMSEDEIVKHVRQKYHLSKATSEQMYNEIKSHNIPS